MDTQQLIQRARERGRRMGWAGQAVQHNERLAAALEWREPQEVHLVLELATCNPRTGTLHHLQVVHEPAAGTDRFAVWVDGTRWRNGWSRSRFVTWMFGQIDSVRRDWN